MKRQAQRAMFIMTLRAGVSIVTKKNDFANFQPVAVFGTFLCFVAYLCAGVILGWKKIEFYSFYHIKKNLKMADSKKTKFSNSQYFSQKLRDFC